jgi:hypothetical protein
MADSLDYAKEWIRDGDRLLQRGGQRLARFDSDREPIHLEAATQDFSRAAQMYLTGAVEYQRGREAATLATASLDDTVRLVQHLEGRLRSEAEAAWQTAKHHLLPSQEGARSGGLEPARSFAESLRDRLSHAAPELFDRPPGHEHSRDWTPSRSR